MNKHLNEPTAITPAETRGEHEFISVREAAARLGVSPSTVYRTDRSRGPYSIVKRGRRVLVSRGSLERFISMKSGTGRATDEKPSVSDPLSAPDPPAQAPRIGTGQRELVFPVSRPSIVFYVS